MQHFYFFRTKSCGCFSQKQAFTWYRCWQPSYIQHLVLATATAQKNSVFRSWLTTFLFIYIGGRGYAYYAFILNAFAAVGVVMCFTLIRSVLRITIAKHVQISQQMAKFLRRMVFVASAVYMLLASPNVYLLAYDKSELPQYEFARIFRCTLLRFIHVYGVPHFTLPVL